MRTFKAAKLDVWFCNLIIYGDAKDIVIRWSAVEKSSKVFNFYVFDDKNFNLWKEGLRSTAYYVGTGSTSYSFTLTFSKKEELPGNFCYVVEVPKYELKPEASEELKRVVEVNAVASWTEITESHKFEYTDGRYFYYISYTPGISEGRNFVIKGNIFEKNGNDFNFYIMDSTNHNNFITDKPFSAHYEKKGTSSDSFSIQLTGEQLKDVYFVVKNPNTNINEIITLKAKLTYEEEVTD
ncbi:MAG: hypothetical protein ACP5KW_11300 [Thermoproteota archaeon]